MTKVTEHWGAEYVPNGGMVGWSVWRLDEFGTPATLVKYFGADGEGARRMADENNRILEDPS